MVAFLRPLGKRRTHEPRSSYIKSCALSLNQVTFSFLLCYPPWHLIQETLFPLHYLGTLWWEVVPCLRRALCVAAPPAVHPRGHLLGQCHTLWRGSHADVKAGRSQQKDSGC